MAFTLDTYSKSCCSDELQIWAHYFRDIFAEKDTYVFIGEANTGKLTDADYIVIICNKIRKGNAYIIRNMYLNRLVFGIKKVFFSEEIVSNPSYYQEQVIHDLYYFKAEAEYNMEQQTGVFGIPLVYVCSQTDVDIHDDCLICEETGDVKALLLKASLQLSTRGIAINNINIKENISDIIDKIKEGCTGKPIPLLLTKISYRQSHKLPKEKATTDVVTFCKNHSYPCIYALSYENIGWNAKVFVLNQPPKQSFLHTTPMGVKIECICDMERFYTSSVYESMDKMKIEITDFEPGNIGKELSKYSLSNVSYTIQIQGSLNGTDILSLREYSKNLIDKQSFLTRLDLSNSNLVAGGKCYFSSVTHWATCDCYTQQDIVTKFIFTDFFVREIVLPKQAMTVEKYAFYNLRTLETIISYASRLERECICDCQYIKNIVLRNVVKRMSSGAVYQCPNLSSVVIDRPQRQLFFDGDSLYTSNKLLLYTNISSSEYTISDGTVEIAPSAFYGKSNLKVVRLNDGLKKIGDEAFAQTGIEILHLPATVKHIGKFCIPSALKDLYVYTAYPCPIAIGTFCCLKDTRLHVPKNTLESYKKSVRWSHFADYIEEDYPPTCIGDIYNHVTGAVKRILTKKLISETPITEVENLNQTLSFGDFHEICKTLFEQKKTLFWLLVRNEKLILSETCVKEIERLYPKRRKETELLYRYLSIWTQEKQEHIESDFYDEETSLRDLERDTYIALGGEDYESFMEHGGDWDNFMDRLGY